MASGLRSASPFVHGSRTLVASGTNIGGRSHDHNIRRGASVDNLHTRPAAVPVVTAILGYAGGKTRAVLTHRREKKRHESEKNESLHDSTLGETEGLGRTIPASRGDQLGLISYLFYHTPRSK